MKRQFATMSKYKLFLKHFFSQSVHQGNACILVANIKFKHTRIKNKIVLKRVQLHFIYPDSVRILCLYCTVLYAINMINLDTNGKKHQTYWIMCYGESTARLRFEQFLAIFALPGTNILFISGRRINQN